MSACPYTEIVEAIGRRITFAAALVLSHAGSTPGRPGMRALIDKAGRIRGTIGGGAMEACVQRRAVACLQTGSAAVLDYVMEGPGAGDGEPICGGRMRILVDPTPVKSRAAYAHAQAARSQRERGILLTTLRGDQNPVIDVAWLGRGELAERNGFPTRAALDNAFATGEPRLFVAPGADRGAAWSAFVEPVLPAPLLVMFGGGHVGQALARQAVLLGFEVGVVDDRSEFVQPSMFPAETSLFCGKPVDAVSRFAMTQDTYVVLVGRGYQQDLEALAACIRKPVGYIGMIGSRRKVALVRRDLIAAGQATAVEFDAVHAPVGIEVGAVTVAEIAVSIAAELIAARRRPAPLPARACESAVEAHALES